MINVRKRLVRLVGAILDWRTTSENKVRKAESMPLRFPCQIAYRNRPMVHSGDLRRHTLPDGAVVLTVNNNGYEQIVRQDGRGTGIPDPHVPGAYMIEWWSSDSYERHDN